tara:strand:- start:12 stop:1418 length:1407 start_codon:yes stop_codon:yes gene_type:complete
MNEQVQKLLSHFYEYAKNKLGFEKDANINFVVDQENSKNPLGTTAHYNPDSMEVTVYTSNRHPKDILRSVAHELVHHRQNCQGKMNNTGPTTPGYAQNDSHLRQLEQEAYLEGNMCFRDWEDTYKANQEVGTIYESVIKTYIKEKLKMSTKEEMRTIVREAVSRVLTQNKIQEMDYEDDAYMDDLEKEFPFLKDEPKMGGKAPADVQAAMDDEMPAEDEMDMDETSIHEGEPCPNGCNCNQKQEEVVAEGDEMSRTITQIETIGDEISRVAGMVNDPAVSERLEMIDDMVTAVLAQMQGVDEASTEKHDDDPALKGDQDELPDHLQKAIIDKAEDEKNEGIEDEIESSDDRYGDMKHIIPGVRFTGDIETDVKAMEENEELADWLYGELGSGDVITDSEGKVTYAGADVQDYLDTSDVVLPDIAETQEDFYAQMRNDARTISEDWNKNIRNKRSSLLNERLMKAWKLG